MARPILATVIVLLALSAHTATAVEPNPAELTASRQWAAANFVGDSKTVPEPFFSFTYDGQPSAELLKTWDLQRTARKVDECRTEYVLAWSDPKTGLTVRCVGIEYLDYRNVE